MFWSVCLHSGALPDTLSWCTDVPWAFSETRLLVHWIPGSPCENSLAVALGNIGTFWQSSFQQDGTLGDPFSHHTYSMLVHWGNF